MLSDHEGKNRLKSQVKSETEFADKMLDNSLIVRASQIKCASEQVAQMFCLGTSTHHYTQYEKLN